MTKRMMGWFCMGIGAAIGCGDSSDMGATTTVTVTITVTGTGGHSAGGSGGGSPMGGHHHDAGHMGGGDAGGHTGGMGGAGGLTPMHPCADVLVDHAVLKFEGDKHDGVLAFGAWVKNPFHPEKSTNWADPYNGCVAKTALDLAVACDFGAGLSGDKIYFNVSLHPTAADPKAVGWFSKITGGKVETMGTYYACHGNVLVGSFVKGSYEDGGVLVPSDDPANPQNLLFVVP